jgi:vanillate O-demethylase ferredoxin subunit
MAAAAEATKGWPAGTVHCEYFTAPPAASVVEDKPFRVRLAKRGVEYEIPVGQTIVGVLRRHGIAVPTSCELGYCGACVTRYLAGEPDHRDQVLREYGRGRFVLICCARSKTPVLHLDL